MASQLRGYLKTLENRLHLDPGERDEILVELETHIEDRTQDLIDEGKSSDEAVQGALSGLGSYRALAGQFYEVHSRGS